jgi:asparagine synthetase B (glutamine-hydrolysing)
VEIPLEKALANFFVCGLVRLPLQPELASRLDKLALRRYDLEGYGQFFFSMPEYLDWAEDEQKVLLKLGFARLGEDFTSAASLLASGLATPSGIDPLRLHGNACLICFEKYQPEVLIYNTLLGTQGSYYTGVGQSLFFSNNLGALARLTVQREINPRAIPLHFIIREVPGKMTYFKDIFHLRPGEALHQQGSTLKVDLRLSLRALSGEDYGRLPVRPETIEEFYELLKTTIGRYLRAFGGAGWTNTLSGGVDSSVLQVAINSLLPAGFQPETHTAAIQTDSFLHEIEYARTASQLFGTRHTFVNVDPGEYPPWLIVTIKLLGQPTYSEIIAYKTAMYAYLASQSGTIRYLFSGQTADALNGLQVARHIYYFEKLRGVPRFIPRLLERGLAPFHLPQIGRAGKALRVYLAQDNPYLPDNFMNVLDNYTNWQVLYACFSPADIHEALDYRNQLEVEYLDSDNLLERIQMVDLLEAASDVACLNHQLALAFDRQVLYPYLDDLLLWANLRFDPRQRFFMGGRTKPVLKYILETKSASQATKNRKAGGGFSSDLFKWMEGGVMREMVEDMQRPDFLSRVDFEKIKRAPDWFTWNALNYDLFIKHVVKAV